jgi:serine/threonine protein kinase
VLNPGTILQNRYRILRQLGAGGMGAVYLADDAHLRGRRVVIKENQGGDARQFEFEASTLATLSHPNLPRVSDHFVESSTSAQTATGAQYLVMDFVEGQNLHAIIHTRGAIAEMQALAWLDQIFDAVSYLHANRIIHRDIKPQNIIITPQGKAVLVDFGIAKIFQTGQFTHTGARAATSGFSAPEQYRGGTDPRSDVYSLGATLYALLVGNAPPDAMALATGTAVLRAPRALNPAISVSVEQTILRALQLQPAQRFQSVDEMRRALRTLAIAPTSPATYTATVPVPTLKTFPAMPVIGLLAIVALFGLCFVFGIAGLVIALNTATPTISPTLARVAIITETPTAPTATPTLTPSATRTRTATPTLRPPTSVPPPPVVSPTPRPRGQIAFAGYRDGNGEIYLMNVETGSVRRLTNHPANDYRAALSPDGHRVAFVSDRDGNAEIYAMNVDGSDLRRLTNNSAPDDYPAWSPTGELIAFSSKRTGFFEIHVMNADGNGARALTNTRSEEYKPTWSPDGSRIAFWSKRDGNDEIYVMNADGSNQVNLTRHSTHDLDPAWSPDGQSIAFAGERDGNTEIYIMSADGGKVRRITNHSARDSLPCWSPDGLFIAFTSRRDGNSEIYIVDVNGANLINLTQNSEGDFDPSWSP